jgi:C4-dicarboxylate-specific signal transduction histidine kinase
MGSKGEMARTPVQHKTVEKDLRQYLDLDVVQRRADVAQRRANFAAEIRKKDPTRAAITFKSGFFANPYPFTGGTALDRVMTDTQRGSPRRSKRDRLHA